MGKSSAFRQFFRRKAERQLQECAALPERLAKPYPVWHTAADSPLISFRCRYSFYKTCQRAHFAPFSRLPASLPVDRRPGPSRVVFHISITATSTEIRIDLNPQQNDALDLLVHDVTKDHGPKYPVAQNPVHKCGAVLGIAPTLRIGLHPQHSVLEDGQEFGQFPCLRCQGSDRSDLLLGGNGVIDLVVAAWPSVMASSPPRIPAR